MDEEQPKSIDETLSEEFDKLTAAEEVTDTETDTETEEETVEAPEESVEETDTKEPEEPDLDDEYKHPPTTWRAEAKSKWADVPNWLKEEVHKREKDSLNGVTSLKEKAQYADRLSQTIQPYQPLLSSMGVTPENAVRDALNLAHSLKTGSPREKAQLLRNIAQQYEVDLSQVTTEPSEIEKALTPYQQELNRLRQQIFQQQTSQKQQQYTAAEQEVRNFAAATDEKGSLRHPYFENVRQDMQFLIEADRATTLEEAYEKACWANPEIRPLLQDQQIKKAEEQRRVAKAQKANQNKVEPTQSEDLKTAPKGSIDETLSEAYDRLTAEG